MLFYKKYWFILFHFFAIKQHKLGCWVIFLLRSAMATKKNPSKEIPIEKRQYLRLGYSRLISFTHYDPESLVEIPGKMAAVHDVSESGILIKSSVAFEPGNVIDLDIAFEQDKIILAQGEVVHCEKTGKNLYRAGIKFLRIDNKDLSYLKKFIDSQPHNDIMAEQKEEIKPKGKTIKSQKKGKK